jgi:hypothetical protein
VSLWGFASRVGMPMRRLALAALAASLAAPFAATLVCAFAEAVRA